MTQILTIKGELPGLNETINSSKKHWSSYYREKRVRQLAAVSAIKKQRIRPVKRAVFRFDWYSKTLKRDPDNIAAGGTKIVLDALQEAGIIENDGHKQVKALIHSFHKDRDNPRVEVTIEEVSE